MMTATDPSRPDHFLESLAASSGTYSVVFYRGRDATVPPFIDMRGSDRDDHLAHTDDEAGVGRAHGPTHRLALNLL